MDSRQRPGRTPGAVLLALAAHPAPTVAVTVLTTVLLAVAGNSPGRCAIGAAALLTGQLSIGWSNDLIDADRDAAAGRPDKPVAIGAIPRGWLVRAIAVAVLLCVPLSFGLGWRAGVAHLVGVGCGWLYNLGAKSSLLSPLPYLIAFGSLPAIATLAAPGHRWPAWWAIAAAALLGLAAHLGNVLPDLAEDAAAGVRGFPHRLGGPLTSVCAAGAVSAASLLVLYGPARTPSPLDYLGLTGVLTLGALGVISYRRRPQSEMAFYATMAAAAVDLALIAASHGLN